ncbi:MAG: polysaccharide deacetylase family protein, partial [Burkholderiales bacterium]
MSASPAAHTGNAIPTQRTANRRPIPILVYHQIAPAPAKGAPFRSLYVSPASFARQMAMLKLLGYTGLSMTALMPYLRGEKTGKVVGITFDDGYLNNLTNALPALQQRGFSSTCYAVSALLGKTNQWDEEVGIAQTPLMDAAQIQAWVDGGQEIGSHTAHHVDLRALADDAGRADMLEGQQVLADITGNTIGHFCYPYGHYE